MVRPQQDNPARPIRRIVGPQSALTDFLASRNISARQIEADFLARREAAARQLEEQQQSQSEPLSGLGAPTTGTDETALAVTSAAATTVANSASGRGLSAAHQTVVEKIKAEKIKGKDKKASPKGKGKRKKEETNGSDEDEDDDLSRALFQSMSGPSPGQLDNCAMCEKRFTVTPYSRADANGRLLCTRCGQMLHKKDDEVQKAKKKPRAAARGPVGQRRQAQSRLLDGASLVGPKSLVTLCVELLSRNIHLAEDLGDLPEEVVNRIARMLSKRRLINPKTLDLFVRPDTEELCVYDCALLTADDFLRMLQAVPRLKRLRLYNAIQFKNEVMDYLLQRDVQLDTLCLYGANLLTDAKWKQYLVERGAHLRTLHICFTDKHITDDVMQHIQQYAPQLTRLKIRSNQEVTGKGLIDIAGLKELQHLGLKLTHPRPADLLLQALLHLGEQLQTLSLREVGAGVDNAVLMTIHEKCRQLRKLRITESDMCTDAGFARLFTDWENPPLHFVDLHKNCLRDADNPRDNDNNLGLCSEGFEALMAHSGEALQDLNIFSCRHISKEAFERVFAAEKKYPELRRIEASFCGEVDDYVVRSMFRCCPKLHEVVTFGCMRVKGEQMPHGRVVVGVPNALGMQTVGKEDEEADREMGEERTAPEVVASAA